MTGSGCGLFVFLAFMQSRSLSITFTMEVTCLADCQRTDEHNCSRLLHFLDTSAWVDEEGRLQTDIHTKANTKIQYLLPSSIHPRHCFPGIAKSLMMRVARICSRPEDRDKRLYEWKTRLLGRGYKKRMPGPRVLIGRCYYRRL